MDTADQLRVLPRVAEVLVFGEVADTVTDDALEFRLRGRANGCGQPALRLGQRPRRRGGLLPRRSAGLAVRAAGPVRHQHAADPHRGLDRLGYTAGDVTTAVISHLHQDHIGGLAELSRADIVVSQAEWGTLSSPLPELRGLMRRHIDLPGLRWRRITPEPAQDPGLAPFRSGHDLFGDGSMVVLPTPGHTPGSLAGPARAR
jgi:glyoxylase-like metal-dependent hydrolase (beta-lactamase superfamily II)